MSDNEKIAYPDLVDRLRALAAQPIDPATQSQHLTAMATAAVDQASRSTFLGRVRHRLSLGAALGVGVLLGATGLASAGALGPLQPIAARGVEAVTPLDVPNGHGDDHGKASSESDEHVKGNEADANGTARVTEGCEAGISTRNRGQYLKGVREKYGNDSAELVAAKASRCGMPLVSDGTPGSDDESDDAADTKASGTNSHKPDDAADASDGASDDKGGNADEHKPASDGNGKAAHATGKPSGTPGAADDSPGKCAGGFTGVGSGEPDCATGDQPAVPPATESDSGSGS